VSDDPDYQVEFTESINEISPETILITVSSCQKALDLVLAKLHVPAYIFLDLSIDGLDVKQFLKSIDLDDDLQQILVIIFGDSADFEKVNSNRFHDFFNAAFGYAELKQFLRKTLKPDDKKNMT
jgi:hypothetical protein